MTTLAELKRENREWEKRFSYLGRLNSEALDLEKIDIYKAIDAHIKAFEYGKKEMNFVNYARNINRLIVLYRKTKQYQNEVDILNFAISNKMHQTDLNKYKTRLNKATELLNQSTNTNK